MKSLRTLLPRLYKTQILIFLALFCFSMLLLAAVSMLYKTNTDDIVGKYKDQHLETVSYALIDDMRAAGIAGGPLTPNQIEWMVRRATIYGVLLQYREDPGSEPWVDMITKHGKAGSPFTSPYLVDGQQVGLLTVAYSGFRDELNPIHIEHEQRMAARSRLLIGIMIFVSFTFSLLMSRFLSRHLSALSDAANRIRMGRRDIAAPVRGPAEIRKLAITLNEMSAELKKQEEWREHLMEDLAHELRTPLMSILVQIEAILDGIRDPDPARMGMIYHELERLARLLNDLQKLSEAENAQFSLRLKRTNMVQLTRSVYLSFLPIAEEKRVKLSFESVNVPCYALVDRDRMIQVISNLVSNAIKYTPAGGRVVLSVDWTADYTLIACKDNGIGIAEEDQPYVFNRLYRVDKSRSRFSGGVGIGLSIAKALAEAHHGRITLESKLGEGSTFTVIVPNELTKMES